MECDHQEVVDHPRVLRMAARSGGDCGEEADARLTRYGVTASFSWALTEGLGAQ